MEKMAQRHPEECEEEEEEDDDDDEEQEEEKEEEENVNLEHYTLGEV